MIYISTINTQIFKFSNFHPCNNLKGQCGSSPIKKTHHPKSEPRNLIVARHKFHATPNSFQRKSWKSDSNPKLQGLLRKTSQWNKIKHLVCKIKNLQEPKCWGKFSRQPNRGIRKWMERETHGRGGDRRMLRQGRSRRSGGRRDPNTHPTWRSRRTAVGRRCCFCYPPLMTHANCSAACF